MTAIEKQVEVLNQLVQLMHDSVDGSCEEMRCEFEYNPYDGGWSVGSKFSFVQKGTVVSEFLNDPADSASVLVHQLHELMKAQTGGDWKGFALRVDSMGKAHTRFTYS